MKCQTCGGAIDPGEEREHHDKIICEDCYMVALSPMKTCDPWAVHSAKSFEKFTGETKQLTQVQEKILQILRQDGAMEPDTLLEKLGSNMQFSDLQREFATLRHMEKVRGQKSDGGVLWRLWG